MRLRLIIAVLGMWCFVSAWQGARAGDRPVPQNPEARRKRKRETLAWNQKTLVGAYDKVGKKDPRWDGLAREALELMARNVSKVSDKPTPLSEVRAALKKAVDAGCDDPLIVFNHVRYDPGKGEAQDRALADAVERMLQSGYPSVRKATALYKAAARKSGRAKTDPKAGEQARKEIDKALAMLSKSFAEDGAGTPLENVWLENIRLNATPVFTVTGSSLKDAYAHIDAALARAPAAKTVRLIYRGMIYKQYAWEARGNGFSNTVSPENFQKFHDRLLEADKALREAWTLNPRHTWIPTVMLDVAKGLELDRQVMELWFERAMTLDENNFWVCRAKLDWLSARWYGSNEETVAFGRACRDTRNMASGIPLLLAAAHLDVYRWLPKERQKDYIASKEVWNDLHGVYEDYLAQYPNDRLARTRYACFSWLSGHYAEAARHFKTLGDRLVPDKDFPEELLKYARTESYGKAGAAAG